MHYRHRDRITSRAAALPLFVAVLAVLAGLLVSCAVRAGESSPALGMPCADRAGLVEQLRERFGETVQGIGLTDAGGVMELYASEKGSWTLVVNLPNGRSCLVATGRDWESIARTKGGDT